MESSTISALTSTTSAFKSICSLKGVGPATASAILSLYNPAEDPFFSDEAFDICIGKGAKKPKYSAKEWTALKKLMLDRVKAEEWENVEVLEMAMWSWGVQKKYGKN